MDLSPATLPRGRRRGEWRVRFASSRAVVPMLFAVTFALRLGFALAWPQTPFSDGDWQLERAGELAAGLGYQEAGYPALLGAVIGMTGDATIAVLEVNLAGAAGTLAMVLWFAIRTGAGRCSSSPGSRSGWRG